MNHTTDFIDYLERKQSEYLEKHQADFVKELFEDEEFLDVNVISHFSRDETEFYGLTLFDVSEPCEHCGDVHSYWWGIVVNTTEKYYSVGCVTCNDSESVVDSIYRGDSVRLINHLIQEHNLKYREYNN